MANPILVSPEVQLPERLNGNPRQPSSLIPNGPWVKIGSKEISSFRVYDAAVSKVMRSLDFYNTDDFQKLFEIGSMNNAKSFRLIRDQRWEFVRAPEEFIIDKGVELELSVTSSYGTSVNNANSTDQTIGISVGNTTTVKAGAKASAGASYGPFSGSVEISAEYQHENSKTFQQELRMGESRSNTTTNNYTTSYKKTFLGGERGWRYVFYKIVDRFRVVRIHKNTKEIIDFEGDAGIVSDVWVSGINQSMRYSLNQ